MATTTVLDLIEGARVRKYKGNVIEVARAAIMRVSTDADPFTEDEVLFAALASDDLPVTGTEHPHEPGVYLTDLTARPMSGGIVRVELAYKRPEGSGFDPPPQFPFEISGDASLQQIETALDRQGNQITVEHEGEVKGGLIHPFETAEEMHLSEVIGTADPTLIARAYSNTVNLGTFRFDQGAPDRTWLFMRVGYDLVDADVLPFPLYRMTYEIRRNPDGFDPQVIWIADDKHEPPPDLVPGTGYKTIPWHTAISWTPLLGA